MLVWQDSQGAVVTICVADLPFAVAPLWQVAQPALMPVWFHFAPLKRSVLLWQVSQGAAVTTCIGGLPRACVPLWQPAHGPSACA